VVVVKQKRLNDIIYFVIFYYQKNTLKIAIKIVCVVAEISYEHIFQPEAYTCVDSFLNKYSYLEHSQVKDMFNSIGHSAPG